MELVYDVAHNIAKVERYPEGELLIHRKGATRAFGPGSMELTREFRQTGQPVICGGFNGDRILSAGRDGSRRG